MNVLTFPSWMVLVFAIFIALLAFSAVATVAIEFVARRIAAR